MTETSPTRLPFVAGMYDYILGGTANTEADRDACERLRQILPEAAETAWANRGFLQRAVRWLAAERGIRQFIDIGAGLPTQRNTHEVAAEVCPGAHVLYADNDPRVVERGRRLLADVPGTEVILADLRRPGDILDAEATHRLIDMTRPVGLLMTAVIQFVPDRDDPWSLVRRYVAAVPSGSYLALSSPTNENQASRVVDSIISVYRGTNAPGVTARGKAEIARFFTGLEIVPPYPGAPAEIGYVGQWGAEDPEAADDDSSRWMYAAVGRKP